MRKSHEKRDAETQKRFFLQKCKIDCKIIITMTYGIQALKQCSFLERVSQSYHMIKGTLYILACIIFFKLTYTSMVDTKRSGSVH